MGVTPEFFEDANCLGLTEVMFPEYENENAIRAAKMVCESCCVIEKCRDYALQTKPSDGVWAGLTTRERFNLDRRNRRNAARVI